MIYDATCNEIALYSLQLRNPDVFWSLAASHVKLHVLDFCFAPGVTITSAARGSPPHTAQFSGAFTISCSSLADYLAVLPGGARGTEDDEHIEQENQHSPIVCARLALLNVSVLLAMYFVRNTAVLQV